MPKSPRNLTKTKTINQDCLNSDKIQSSVTKKTRKKSTKHQENTNGSTKKDSNSNQNSSNNNDIDNDTFVTPTTKAKRNAFELMMDSRHKVIGRNSPGKERESDDDDDDDDGVDDKTDKKSEKISRRLFLENWADSKGASKRKRIDEEIERCINEKMEKRSKRLKEMLKIKPESEEEEEETNTKLTNKNLKSWRMKIKLCMEENQEKIENDTNNKNGRIVGGRVLREKKLKPNHYNEDGDYEKTTPKKTNCVTIVLDDDLTKQTTKIAPVFRRSIPKPKIDPAVVEAKREFLLSGIPTMFRKELTKHPSFEDVKFDVFPTVSHVQQRDDHNFWNLDKVDLKLLPLEEIDEILDVANSKFQLVLNQINENNDNCKLMKFEKIKCYRTIVEKIKLQNPDYPIYRMFKILYEQSGYKERIVKNEKIIVKKRGRKKNNDKNIKINDTNDCLLWTDKYKPKDSKQILGNHHTVASLKNWLSSFKQTRKLNNSESEFDTDDSRDSYNTTRNTIILTGPCGCGKTSAIYAICNELDYNIIEINTSMKRTGKRLIHDLQEATQSHQVRRQQQQQQQNNLTKFLKQPKQQQQGEEKEKFCVLLIEDIDIIFEQEDESFYSALNQISSITKRPIILTTNNYNSLIEQKFLLQFQVFRFLSPITSTTILLINLWLQLICLIEGIHIDLISIKQLFIRNCGDIRRTLLELQFWVNTGGQIKQQKQQQFHQQINIDNSCDRINNKDDDDSNLSTISPNEDQLINHKIHNNCIDCFETTNNNLYELRNLERIWWNLPNLLQLPDCRSTRLRSLLINNNNNDKEIIDNNDMVNLRKYSKIYDNLLLTDFYSKSYTINSNLDQLWHVEIKDSLSINENFENFTNPTIGYDLSHYLIFNSLKYYGFQTEQFNSAVPEPIEIKWRNKMRSCDKNFRNAIPLMTEQNSIKLDYMPMLRNIARSELQRSVANTKRNHRFYNYLRNLGINCNDKTYQLACDIFKI